MRPPLDTSSANPLVQALAGRLQARIIETHISWVLLAGEFAYKIKKPLRLGFLDYTSLAARQHFCREEVRLNRRLAPAIYLDVASITGTLDAPSIDGAGIVLEYAVRMRRFADGALFSEQVSAGTLPPADVTRFAACLARFHASAPHAVPGLTADGGRSHLSRAVDALEAARPLATAAEYAGLAAWLARESARLGPLWARRVAEGRVRECHGDLHLANVVGIDSDIAAFDCIEFDPDLRWLDVIDDAGFAAMDFAARGRGDYAFRFINEWLDHTGDHGAVPALRFAVVYRALVRALACRLGGPARNAEARRYLDTALAWLQPASARLTITHGLPGSGKTFASQRLLERDGAIRLRSDVERKRLFGLAMHDGSRARGLDIYGAAASARTYQRLFDQARAILRAGYPVVLDAAFLRRAERGDALALARECDVPFGILACEAGAQTLRARLAERVGDASEADATVLARLGAAAEPLSVEERAFVVPIPTEAS